ncbi:jg22682 [Pararge aegeria aegeria]|uniref:Jg22682 protein n=1 Tax=Pararge aegeria aegeria TaxID=348720 RepID=A0A8S4S4F7_9NEOP|nr:jg22682 [Pararge aegeria aegeria]
MQAAAMSRQRSRVFQNTSAVLCVRRSAIIIIMKPLLRSVVVISLLLCIHALPENIEEVKQLPQSKEPVLEAEESEAQARVERCTSCTSVLKVKSPKEALAALTALPGAEIHTQQSFQGCSSEKGCAGIKVKDGNIIEKYGNVDAFNAAAAADINKDFTFHAAGALGDVFSAALGNSANPPFWWMNKDSPFKAGSGATFEKYSQSESSSFSGGANAGNFGAAALNLAANPFLNGDLSKGLGIAGAGVGSAIKPAAFQSSSAFESSYSSSNNGAVDLSKNPFLNGGFKAGQAAGFQGAIGAQAANSQGYGAALGNTNLGAANTNFGAANSNFGGASSAFDAANTNLAAANSNFGAANTNLGAASTNFGAASSNFGAASSTFGASGAANTQGFGAGGYNAGFGAAGNVGTGYTGSSPSPFVPTSGSNVNLIQSEKANEFDFQQQQQTQQNIDEIFQSSGNVGLEVSGGDFQQACNSQGYVCALKTQCTNGVVNANVVALLQAQPKKPYCSTLTEICCRIDVSTIASSLGVGSTFAAQGAGFASQGANAFNAQRGSSFGSQSSFGKGTTQSAFGSGFGSTLGATAAKGTTRFGSGTSTLGSSSTGAFGSSLGAKGYGSTAAFGANRGISTVAPTTSFGAGLKPVSQSNFIDTDSFSAGSETAGVYRPGAVGTVLKPGIPYLPPVDNTNSGTNIVSSTVFPNPTFVTTPKPFTTPRPIITPRPIVTRKPTYIPPPIPRPITSTAAPAYLPPIGEQTIQRETIVPPYSDGSLILDQLRPAVVKPTPVPIPSEIPAGCAAALKCTPIEFCTAEGVISNTTVFLTRDQNAYRVPLTDCRDLATGVVGKCCRDPWYTDPWPTNQLGKWVPGVFGGNDGKYVPDSRPSPNNVRPPATARPPATGSVYLNNFITPKPTVSAYRPPVTPVTPITPFPAKGQFGLGGQGQFGIGGQGQYGQGGRGQVGIVGQGQIGSGSQTNTAFAQGTRGQGAFVSQGQGELVSQGQGQYGQVGVGQIGIGGAGQFGLTGQGQQTQFGVGQKGVGLGVTTGQGQYGLQGQGVLVSQGEGQFVSQGQGAAVSQGAGFGIREGQGQFVSQGQGSLVSQGVGQGVRQGQGQFVSQGVGQGVRQGQGAIVTQGQAGFGSQGAGGFVSQGAGGLVSQSEGGLASQGQGAYVSNGVGQGIRQGQGAIVSQGVGQGIRQGQGAYVSQGVGQGVTQGFGQGVIQGQGELVSQGNGALVSQGFGAGIREGQGQYVSQGQGALVSQGFGQGIRRGQGQLVSQGKGQYVSQGGGVITSQGFGQAIRQGVGQIVTQGQGQIVSQGQGFGVENEYGESVNRVFLQRYTGGGGQCGVLNPQRPAGNRKDLEVDFAEIPWQAMVLLQTNKSLLCGGVITRPDVVVTSAACVDGLDAKNVLIKGGEWKLGIDDEPLPFQIVQVKTILRHPLYKSGSLLYDAAILVLTENLRFAKNIYPICLPEAEDTYDALYAGEGTCIVTGWGKQVLQG